MNLKTIVALTTLTMAAAQPLKGKDRARTATPRTLKGRDVDGSSYCTYAPAYDCYKSGWPGCCDKGNCPPNPPPCDVNTPSPTPPKSRKSKSPTPSPTKSPKSKSKVTPSPTRRSKRRDQGVCPDPDDRPRPVRNGQRFRFNIVKSNALCVDEDGYTYSYGQFDYIKSFDDCADACVNDVGSDLINSGSFRGIDYGCKRAECRCLYDEGTLNNRRNSEFDRVSRHEHGYGSIENAKSNRNSQGLYCGKLVGAEFMAADGFLNADVTELWDSTKTEDVAQDDEDTEIYRTDDKEDSNNVGDEPSTDANSTNHVVDDNEDDHNEDHMDADNTPSSGSGTVVFGTTGILIFGSVFVFA